MRIKKIAGMSSDGSIKTACVMFAVYGMARTLWWQLGMRQISSVGALSVVGLTTATLFFCLSLCWLVLYLVYTVFSLMVLSVLSLSWSCGALCLQ